MKNIVWLVLLFQPVLIEGSAAILFGVLSIISSIGLMAAAGWLIIMAAYHPPLYELSVAIAGVRFFGISRAVLRYGERYFAHNSAFLQLVHLRKLFFTALEKMPQRQFDKYYKGVLLERIIEDIEFLQYFYIRAALPLVTAIIIFFFTGMYVYLVDVRLLWLLISVFAFGVLLGPFLIYRWRQKQNKTVNKWREELKNHVADLLVGCEEVAAFQLAARYRLKITNVCEGLFEAQTRLASTTAVLEGFGSLTTHLAAGAALYILVYLLQDSTVSGIETGVIFLLIASSLESVTPLFNLPHYWYGSLSAAGRIRTIIKEQQKEPTKGLLPKHYDLVFKQVTVQYDTANCAVNDISFNVPFGKKVAIVGANGAGKTTLIKALLSLAGYQGSITLGGQEIRLYSLAETQEFFSVVNQHVYLFAASIKDNLCLSKPDATEEELWEAVKTVGALEFISNLEQAMETPVGQAGLALSGGQRQQLSLARAHLKNAPILVLDEPTVGLDALTAQKVLKALIKNRGQTVLLVTHSVCDLSFMDEIIVMDKGKIIEQGTNSELIAKEGTFYQMQLQRNKI